MPYAELADPQSLNLYSYVRNIPTTRYDKDGHCAADKTKCKDVQVTANPPEQKAPIGPVKVTDKNGVEHNGVGPHAKITFTVNVKGKPVDGVQVTETNTNKRTVNGKNLDSNPNIEGKGATENGGHFTDNVGMMLPTDGSDKQNGPATNFWNTSTGSQVNTQTVTMTFPDGATCTCTETRTLTNIDSQGKRTDYTLTTTQPVVQDPTKKGPQ